MSDVEKGGKVKRRTVVMGFGAAAGVAAVGGCTSSTKTAPLKADTSTGSTSSGALAFDKDDYTEKTTTITTDDGDKKVTYRFYGPLTYVAKPVDEDYQSLVVSVPVKIDGKDVDASDAPIVFANSVGGYLPASVKDATGVGGGGTEMGGSGMPSGQPPGAGSASPTTSASSSTSPTASASGTAKSEASSGSNEMLDAAGQMVSLSKLGLAAGYVVVEPGCRGRTLKNSDGEYYGTAPAAIVDLKAALRYVRSNKGRIPGNTDRIVSTGTSAGGALSALLGASGDSEMYDAHLKELGAADASDAVFASGDWCPITDLEHADGAYEWCWGTNKLSTGKQVDQTTSKELKAQFVDYQATLKLSGLNGFGTLTARNYSDYLVKQYLQPSATKYLKALSDAKRKTYLAENTFITWKDDQATFTWEDFLTHVGARKKTIPAFDAFDLSAGENNLFGKGRTKARHFTVYSQERDTTGLTSKRLDSDIPEKLHLMNPMYFIGQKNPNRSKHWWIRLGTKDTDTSLTVSTNLAAALNGLGDDVNHLMYWDEGHGSNSDAGDFITWVAKVTGYKK